MNKYYGTSGDLTSLKMVLDVFPGFFIKFLLKSLTYLVTIAFDVPNVSVFNFVRDKSESTPAVSIWRHNEVAVPHT